MRSIFITSVAILFICTGCAQSTTQQDWLKENSVDLKSGDQYDFSSLKESLKNVRIVAIGESTHGLGEFYSLKSALVNYLHQELDYQVIAIEGGLGDINLAFMDIENLTARQLRDQTVFGNFRAKEIMPLYDGIKSSVDSDRPLYYAGFDSQSSSNYFENKLEKVLRPINPSFADSLEIYFSSYQKIGEGLRSADSTSYLIHRDLFMAKVREASMLLKQHKNELFRNGQLDRRSYLIMQRTLRCYYNGVNLPFENGWSGIAVRDSLMAENVRWLLDSIYPDKKVMVWAHNGHIENNGIEKGNMRLMGHFLKEEYQDDYFSIGLFAKQGEAYQFWTQSNVSFDNAGPDYLENIMMTTKNNISFLPIRNVEKNPFNAWLFEAVKGFEMENGGIVEFIPKKRFDALITVKNGGPPTFSSQ